MINLYILIYLELSLLFENVLFFCILCFLFLFCWWVKDMKLILVDLEIGEMVNGKEI